MKQIIKKIISVSLLILFILILGCGNHTTEQAPNVPTGIGIVDK